MDRDSPGRNRYINRPFVKWNMTHCISCAFLKKHLGIQHHRRTIKHSQKIPWPSLVPSLAPASSVRRVVGCRGCHGSDRLLEHLGASIWTMPSSYACCPFHAMTQVLPGDAVQSCGPYISGQSRLTGLTSSCIADDVESERNSTD